MGFEPTTFSLATRCSTAELHPHQTIGVVFNPSLEAEVTIMLQQHAASGSHLSIVPVTTQHPRPVLNTRICLSACLPRHLSDPRVLRIT